MLKFDSAPRHSVAYAFWGVLVCGSIILGGLTVVGLRQTAVADPALCLAALAVYLILATGWVWRSTRRTSAGAHWAGRLASSAYLGLGLTLVLGALLQENPRDRLLDGANMSNPARAAVSMACRKNQLAGGQGNPALGLDEPTGYAGPHTYSVTAAVASAKAATVTVVTKAVTGWGLFSWFTPIPEGSTLVYRGKCIDGSVHWSLGGSVPARYRPLI